MILGIVSILAALSLFLWNQREDRQAGASAENVLSKVIEQIETAREYSQNTPYPNPYDTVMTEVEIDGYAYIGYLSIPAAKLELPVMSEWDYTRLRIAPCRYFGSTKSDNLVIAGHNYSRHFRPIKNLSQGDAVVFEDMDGIVSYYTVVEVEVLTPADTEEMIAGDYDLTLFTCNYGGQSRVTVRCNRSSVPVT